MGAGNPPPALTGREDQETQFRTLLGRLRRGRSEQSMIVFGLRGVGKTVLLLEFEGIADAEGWIAERRTTWEQRLDRLGEYLAEHPDGP